MIQTLHPEERFCILYCSVLEKLCDILIDIDIEELDEDEDEEELDEEEEDEEEEDENEAEAEAEADKFIPRVEPIEAAVAMRLSAAELEL